MTRTIIACVSVLGPVVAACGGGSDEAAVPTDPAVAETEPASTEQPAPTPAEPLATEPSTSELPSTEPAPAHDVAITAEGVHGYWVNTAGASSLFVDFRMDGTFTIGDTGRLRSGAFTNGTFETIDETTISFTTADDASDCPGVTMTWTGVADDQGIMTVEALAPDCDVPVLTPWEWTRVSPASTTSLSLQAGDIDVEPAAATETAEIEGLWLRPGTGDVLAIDPAGTYLLISDGNSLEPLDSGTYLIEAPGLVTFTSDGSGECDEGEAWTWHGVTTAKDLLRENQARGFSMRADSTELCGPDGGDDAWRLLSPEKT
ncbi:hypothetical protein [Ilumatobacter sp.]|uniref:hypothetical protein n=1 Tax=Ilumatobacter sp. TaxID=1967498 RepID=UPI003C380833